MLRFYLIEEYRRHASIAKKYSLLVFPIYIAFFVAIGASFIDDVFAIFPYRRFILITMLSTFIYGLGVSSFEFLGRGQEKASLSSVCAHLPLSYRKNYLYIFLRDIIYYTILFLLPTYIGLLVSTPFSKIGIERITTFTISILLSMLLGYSAGYLTFAIWHRNRKVYYGTMGFILAYLILAMLQIIPFPPAMFQITKQVYGLFVSLITFLALSIMAYVLTPTEIKDTKRTRTLALQRYHRVFKNIIVAKEMEDVIRGGIVVKSLFTYFFPMLLLLIFVRIINMSMGREVYNPMSMSVMLSIFSAVIYSWLTILEDFEYYAILPIKPSDIVKTHIKVYLLLITLISIPIIIAFNINSMDLLPWSLGLFYLNSLYLLSITAYIAGPKITSLLFNPGIVIRFSIYSIVPGMILVIATFEKTLYSTVAVLITAGVMMAITIVNFKRIEKKWIYF